MHWIDWVIVLCPLVVVCIIGLKTQKYVKGVSDFLSAGRVAGRYVLAVAEGEADAIKNVFNAIHSGKPDEKLITLKYLEMLPKLAEGKANKIFLPIEASGIISSLAAMVEGIKPNNKGSVPPPEETST